MVIDDSDELHLQGQAPQEEMDGLLDPERENSTVLRILGNCLPVDTT